MQFGRANLQSRNSILIRIELDIGNFIAGGNTHRLVRQLWRFKLGKKTWVMEDRKSLFLPSSCSYRLFPFGVYCHVTWSMINSGGKRLLEGAILKKSVIWFIIWWIIFACTFDPDFVMMGCFYDLFCQGSFWEVNK